MERLSTKNALDQTSTGAQQMNVSDIDDAAFPMFKINWYERRVLRKIRRKFRDGEVKKPYLCHVLPKRFMGGLRRKIDKALGKHLILDNVVQTSFWHTIEDRRELRIRWIDLLLIHNNRG